MVYSGNKKSFYSPVVIAVCAIIALAAVLLAIFGGRLSPSVSSSEAGDSPSFPHEAGLDAVYARAGNLLASADTSGAVLYDTGGTVKASASFAMKIPAIAASDRLCAFYDAGGTSLRIADVKSGVITRLEQSEAIISVSAGAGGAVAVTSQHPGYKGRIAVYDDSLALIFEWFSGEAYPLSAALSPDGKSMAALSADSFGSRVTFFLLDSDTEQGVFELSDELIFDIRYLDGSVVCAITESAAYFIKAGGELISRYDYSGRYLACYEFADGYVALYLGQYRYSGEGALITLDADGGEKGVLGTDERPVSLSAYGKRILALYGGAAALYTDTLVPAGTITDAAGYTGALLSGKGAAMLISPYSVTVANIG